MTAKAACRMSPEWPLILLTICLVLLTALQANGSLLTRGFAFVNQSRNYSIFFLRAVSELAGLSLAATLAVTLESMKWSMMTTNNSNQEIEVTSPARLVKFLALDVGTSFLGVLQLLFSPSVGSRGAKLWSIARLAVMAVVPVTGILIMSNVDVRPIYAAIEGSTSYPGYGLSSMNASSSIEYIGFTDIIFGSKFLGFVQAPSLSIDLTPESLRQRVCGLNAAKGDESSCNREYFLIGEAGFMAPEITNNPGHTESDIILTTNHRGYYLRFAVGDAAKSFSPTDCKVYSGRFLSYNVGAIYYCVVNTAANELHARVVKCPDTTAFQSSCLNTTLWHQDPGWVIQMSASFRHASVAYSRINGTILWHSFNESKPEVPAEVDAADILKVYDNLLFDTTKLGRKKDDDLPLFSSSSFATLLYLSIPEFTVENARNPRIARDWFTTMQTLLAMPLYYCQPGMLRRLVPLRFPGVTLESNLDRMLSPLPERTTTTSFAYQRFETVADHGTLIAYVVLSGVALLFCAGVQVALGIAHSRGRAGLEHNNLSSFGAVDLFRYCTVEDKGRVVYRGESSEYQEMENGFLGWLSELRIRWAGDGSKQEMQGLESRQYGSQPVWVGYEAMSKNQLVPGTPLSGRSASFSSPRPAYYCGIAK
ncbi:hypothetical protein OQA88_10591 [Cercophora sp. LCS_1]